MENLQIAFDEILFLVFATMSFVLSINTFEVLYVSISSHKIFIISFATDFSYRHTILAARKRFDVVIWLVYCFNFADNYWSIMPYCSNYEQIN